MKATLIKTRTGYQIQAANGVRLVSTQEAEQLKSSAREVRLVVDRGMIRGMEWTIETP